MTSSRNHVSFPRKGASVVLSVALAASMSPAAAFAASQAEQAQTVVSSDTAAPGDNINNGAYGHMNLKDGTYDISLEVNSTNHVDSAIDMAGGAFSTNAKLVVENGQYSIIVTMQHGDDVPLQGGYDLSNVKYCPDGCTITNGVAKPTNYANAQVITTRESNGKTYPEQVKMSLSSQAKAQGYVYVSCYVAAMSTDMGWILKLNWDEFEANNGLKEPSKAPDKTQLNATIAQANAIKQATGPDYAMLSRAIKEAQDVANNDAATQDQIDAQNASLSQSIARYNGQQIVALEDDKVYTAPVSFVSKTGSSSGASNNFAPAATVEKRGSSYRVSLTTKADADAALSGFTYGATKTAAEVVDNGDGTRTVTVATDDLNQALPFAYKMVIASGSFAGNSYATSTYIWLDLANIAEQPTVDKSKLATAISVAKSMQQGEKTDEAYAALQSSIANAQAVYDDDAATQDAVDAQVSALVQAVSDFNASADKQHDDYGIEEGKVYTAAISWVQDDGSAAPAMVTNNLKSTVQITRTGDTYSIDITPTEDGDAFITGMRNADGEEATVVSAEGATPKTYRITSSHIDGLVPVDVYVNPMQRWVTTQNIQIDPSTIKEQAAPAAVDKTALNAAIANAQAVEQGKKTDEAFAALQQAIADAQAVAGDAGATQDAVNAAVTALDQAVDTFNNSADAPASDTVAMYRLYNPYTGEHFYTADATERAGLINIGWSDEGVGWYAPTNGTPVYRLYNGYAPGGEHHYTMDKAERDSLVKAGWNDEGVAFHSASESDENKVAVYREYNPNAFSCNHNYTADPDEHNGLVRAGWSDEGVGWYGVKMEQ